jgi:hypothetical protein
MFNNLNFKVMKTMSLKKIALVAMVFSAGLSSYAQVYTLPSVGQEGTDTVAIGSKAKYIVTRDPAVNTVLFLASGFDWTNDGGFTFEQTTGAALTSLIGSDASSDQNEVVMNAAGPVGTYNVTAAERSRPITGTGCVDATPSTLPVEIVTMPVMGAYGADSGNCGTPVVSLLVPVVLTGYGKYDVTLSIAAFDLSNVAIGVVTALDLNDADNFRTKETARANRLTVPVATLTTAAGGAIPAGGCYFVITATDLQDRISQKNHNYNWVAHTGEIANANPDGADDYRFYIYPVPATQPIQHIQNGW